MAAVAGFLYAHGANITDLQQHSTDPEGGTFFMRVAFTASHLDLARPALERAFQEAVAERFGMAWRLAFASERKRTAILVSKPAHALLELLWRYRVGELPMDLRLVVSNHPDHREEVERFGIPYHHVPVERERKEEAEGRILALLEEAGVELLVLARYIDPLALLRGPLSRAHHQHPPLLPPRLRRGQPLPPGLRAGGEAHRGHGPLRDRGAGPGAHH
ncbi:MAG: formyltransferase family protein [Thermus aquaticus]|uniref:formyltransferase family protein n=1 Tax=Thermus aquaticus TaxID=271 RepID=UPI003C0DDF87